MSDKLFNVLFICNGNSARSIFAECLINRHGRGRFRGFSAGSHPAGEIDPFTFYELHHNNYITSDLRSKDWSEFFPKPGVEEMDFVITVCAHAAAEPCPQWPGQPMTAHWHIADPVAVEGGEMEKKAAFAKAFRELEHRISIFANLPIRSLERLSLQQKLHDIGQIKPEEQRED